MIEIKTIENISDLKRLFNFLSEVFYDEATNYNEHYYVMSERYNEMKEQFEVDNHFLMYIEQDGKIIAGITAKDMNKNSKKITLSILAVSNSERKKGLARELVLEFEKRCKIKKIKYIELGARFRACSFYEKLSYNYCLMIQVFDFSTIEDVRNKNKYNFEEISSFQGETYGCICFKVPSIKKEYIDYFEKNVKTAYAQYIFKKEL